MTAGIYVLIIAVNRDLSLNVGRLGNLSLRKGYYAYMGSAQTNLEKRVLRHMKKAKSRFWHIVYLLENDAAEIKQVFYREARRDQECIVASKIASDANAVPGFGSSDCHCTSHLYKLSDYSYLATLMKEMRLKQLDA